MNIILERLKKPIHIPAALLWSLFALFFGSPILVLIFRIVRDPIPVGGLRQWIQLLEFLILFLAALGAVAFIAAWCCAGLIAVVLAVATGRLCVVMTQGDAPRKWNSLPFWIIATCLVGLLILLVWNL